MRIFVTFFMVLIFLASNGSAHIGFESSSRSSLAPWTSSGIGGVVFNGDPKEYVTYIKKKAEGIKLGHRPDILKDILPVADSAFFGEFEAIEIVQSVFGERLPGDYVQELSRKLTFFLPVFYSVLNSLFEQYPDRTFIFLGRDSDYIYDVACILAAGTEAEGRLKLLPASHRLTSSMEKMLGMRSDGKITPEARELCLKFFASVGITQQAIRSGRRFVLVDTASASSTAGPSSAPSAIRKIMRALFPIKEIFDTKDEDKALKQFNRLFKIQLLYANLRDSKKGRQLDYPGAEDTWEKFFSNDQRLMRMLPDLKQDSFIGRMVKDLKIKELIDLGSGKFPVYYGSFMKVEDEGGLVYKNHPASNDNINPARALFAQLLLSYMVTEDLRLNRNRAGDIRSSLSSRAQSGLFSAA